MKKAQAIGDQAGDLGLSVEPPDGIEPSTYALRVRPDGLVYRLVLVPRVVCWSVVVRWCSPVWLLHGATTVGGMRTQAVGLCRLVAAHVDEQMPAAVV